MAERYGHAIASIETQDVFELCRLLALSAREAIEVDRVHPHNDPAVRLIANHMAFVLNGDIHSLKFYQDTYAYCARMAERERLGLKDDEKEKKDGPVYNPS